MSFLISTHHVKNSDDLELLARNSLISERVNAKIKDHHTVDVTSCMSSLSQVGQLLQVAYASSKGSPCSEGIIKILAEYQTFIKNAVVATDSFVMGCIKAIQLHADALEVSEAGEFEEAVQMIGDCKEVAAKMVKISEALLNEADCLCSLSQKSLEEATKDATLKEDERRKFEADINEEKFYQASIISEQSSINNDIKSVSAEETSIDIFEAKSTKEERSRLEKLQKEACSRLSKSLQKSKCFDETSNSIKNAITSLDITIRTMTKIKTTFENTKIFWMGVQKQCEELEKKNKLKFLVKIASKSNSSKQKFIDDINGSGICWAALGLINIQASQSTQSIAKKVDGIIDHLPDTEEVPKMIQSISQNLLNQLEQENKQISRAY